MANTSTRGFSDVRSVILSIRGDEAGETKICLYDNWAENYEEVIYLYGGGGGGGGVGVCIMYYVLWKTF